MLTLATLFAGSLVFYYRQNVSGQIGGPISVPKLLWLVYALVAWFVVPLFCWRARLLAPVLRRIYAFHFVCFALRGIAELWMLYVTVSWIPPYGIAHDLFDMALITALLWRSRAALAKNLRPWDAAARRFLTSIRLSLVCEIVFASLFHEARKGQMDLYFASSDPFFARINALTAVVVVVVYPDLVWVLWKARAALFSSGAALGAPQAQERS